jgi:hypothetical protein
MGLLLDKPGSRAGTSPVPSVGGERAGGFYEIRFVPARWLVQLLGIARTVLMGGKIPKLGLAGLLWSFAPRAVKIAAVAVATAAIIVVAGALAAIALLALQIS